MKYKCIPVYKIASADQLNTSQQCDRRLLRNVVFREKCCFYDFLSGSTSGVSIQSGYIAMTWSARWSEIVAGEIQIQTIITQRYPRSCSVRIWVTHHALNRGTHLAGGWWVFCSMDVYNCYVADTLHVLFGWTACAPYSRFHPARSGGVWLGIPLQVTEVVIFPACGKSINQLLQWECKYSSVWSTNL